MKFSAHVILSKPCEVKVMTKAIGYGDGASEVVIDTDGRVMDFRVGLDGRTQFGIHIDEVGRLTITDYASMVFNMFAPPNLTLYPQRPWKWPPLPQIKPIATVLKKL